MKSIAGSVISSELFSVVVLASLAVSPVLADEGFIRERVTELRTPAGEVERARRSADGSYVIYVASQDRWGTDELYSAPAAGGPPIKLNPPMVLGGDVRDFLIAPDSAHVLYRADADVDEKVELYRVPIGGGASEKMNGPMVPAGDVAQFAFSPTSEHVLYTATQDHYQITDLYSHILATGTVSRLNMSQDVHEEVHRFVFSPDGNHVAFVQGDYRFGNPDGYLYASAIDGGGAVLLEPEPVETFFEVSLDSQEVFYLRKVDDLRRVPITGGAATDLLPPGVKVDRDLTLTPDQGKAIFIGDGEELSNVLYSLDLVGGVLEQISVLGQVSNALLSENGSTVLFCSGSPFGGPLKTVQLPAGSPIEIYGGCPRESRWISADGARVVYRGPEGHYLAVPADGSAEGRTLTREIPDFATILPYGLDPSGQYFVYVADLEEEDRFELYSVPWAGGAPVRLNGDIVPGGGFLFLHEVGEKVLYGAEQDMVDVRELFEVPVGGGLGEKVSGPMLGTGGVAYASRFSPDGAHVLFQARQNAENPAELWSYAIGQGGPAIALSESLLPTLSLLGFSYVIDPASDWVVFRARLDTSEYRVFSVPIGGGVANVISDPADGSISYFGITGDSQWVFYRARGGPTDELRRAPIGGGMVETVIPSYQLLELSPGQQRAVYRDVGGPWISLPLAGGETIEVAPPTAEVVEFSPDGTRLVYWIDEGFGELYSVSSSGGIATRLHDGSSPCNGSARDFYFSADSSRVIFQCSGSQYVVPIDGGAVTLLTSFPLSDVITTADGSTVLGLRTNRELITVPISGGAHQTLMILPFEVGGSIHPAFELTPDESYVVARSPVSIPPLSGNDELRSVPLAGGPVVRLNPPETRVGDFEITPDGQRVVYVEATLRTSNQDSSDKEDLISVAVGGGDRLRFYPEAPSGGLLRDFDLHGDSVLFTSNLEQDLAMDLYLARPIGIFADDFESGGLSSWTLAMP